MSSTYEHEQAVAVAAVREAARLCRRVRELALPDLLSKKDQSPVTVADFGSQAVICRALQEAFPDDPVIAEEDSTELRKPSSAALLGQVVDQVRTLSAGQDPGLFAAEVCRWIDRGATSRYCTRFWAVDPIDGTKGFLRNEQYAVALALVVEGQVVVGALACPNLLLEPDSSSSSRGAVLMAVRGQGSVTLLMDHEDRIDVPSRPIRVSEQDDPRASRFCEPVEAGHGSQNDAAAIAAALGIVMPPVRIDSQAKYGVVARGEAEIYLRMPTQADYREKVWDHAAGALIVEEAGGLVTDISGRPLEFHHGRELVANRGVIATNGRLHSRVMGALRSLGLAER
jgi:3'(2'), 5'-bisphosphate nucleotidase